MKIGDIVSFKTNNIVKHGPITKIKVPTPSQKQMMLTVISSSFKYNDLFNEEYEIIPEMIVDKD